MERTTSLIGAAFVSASMLASASAQDYDSEKAERAKAFFTTCAVLAQDASDADSASVIDVCKQSMDGIAGLFSEYPEHTPMDLNMLAAYSGASAYIVMARDLVLHENRLSVEGCNHAHHVSAMYNMLTAETDDEVEALLRSNAETVREHLIPWCDESYSGTD
ncbi:MAG: hypothetical protein HRT82_07870 [Henriciella sp.]|nr:hypothetical protein [Henriciella sp.]